MQCSLFSLHLHFDSDCSSLRFGIGCAGILQTAYNNSNHFLFLRRMFHSKWAILRIDYGTFCRGTDISWTDFREIKESMPRLDCCRIQCHFIWFVASQLGTICGNCPNRIDSSICLSSNRATAVCDGLPQPEQPAHVSCCSQKRCSAKYPLSSYHAGKNRLPVAAPS